MQKSTYVCSFITYIMLYTIAIPAMLNMYSVKLTLKIITTISIVKFIACACITVFGIYYIVVNGQLTYLCTCTSIDYVFFVCK